MRETAAVAALARAAGSSSSASHYALKKTAFGSAGQPDRQKVEVEAKALERLHHPNVVRHFAAWTEERHFCILMEYAERGDFAKLLSQRWEAADAAGLDRLKAQVRAALAAADIRTDDI